MSLASDDLQSPFVTVACRGIRFVHISVSQVVCKRGNARSAEVFKKLLAHD